MKHKDIMRRAGKAKHIHCKFCGMDFKTEVAHMTHIHQVSDLSPQETTNVVLT